MSDNILDDIYHVKQFHTQELESIGIITQKDKFVAAKQILLGIAVLYVITIIAFMINPKDGEKLVDICMTVFPPLATLILVFYFKERN
jgi:hypothetical protein